MSATEYFDVIIIGAGLSGIGAACHLKKDCPQKTFAILEGRDAMGGTWDLFRYPGIRSDSDMYTLGYNFKPWTQANGIADGKDIREYIRQTAEENNINPHIRYGSRVINANWDSETGIWQLTVNDSNSTAPKHYVCNFLLCCTGYYNYDQGYTPDFPGIKDFAGPVIHPQQWPENLDYRGKKVVVIGSGATAVTLVPAMAAKAGHVTMLQRSPTYVMSLPQDDPMVNALRKLLPEKWVYRITRTRNISLSWLMYNYCKAFPKQARKLIYKLTQTQVGPDFDMKHFSPSYNPWDERLCAVPDGDLFKAIREKQVSVVTDHIDTFTKNGIRLKSGEELDADIIVTATGLDLEMFGKMEVQIDHQPLVAKEKMVYRGFLLEDLPNAGMVFGYTNASWTLKADLITEWMCRLLNHMDASGKTVVVPRNVDASVEHRPFVDMASGYIQRALDKAPKQGSVMPWKLYQNYALDMAMLRFGKVNDPRLHFSTAQKPLEQTKNNPESVFPAATQKHQLKNDSISVA